MSDWSDEKIALAGMLIGFVLVLARRKPAWIAIGAAAVGAMLFAFVIDPHDSPIPYWMVAMLTGCALGGLAKRAGNLIVSRKVEHGRG